MTISKKRQPIYIKILVITIIINMGLLGLMNFRAVAVVPNSPTTFLTSKFYFNDGKEILIDKNFTIHMLNYNYSYYEIEIDELYFNGTFFNYETKNIILENRELILRIIVKINNETSLTYTNIIIMEGLSASGIQRSTSPFTINLSPFEWNKKEWNIFWAVITASLIGILISYRLVLRYRKVRGIRELK